MLKLDNVVKHYRAGEEPVRAIDGVTLRIRPGEFVALYGPSGSGKTTLLDLVAGFQRPDSGIVYVGGVDVAAMSERQHAEFLLHTLGIIGGPEYLLPGATAAENASLKLWRVDVRHASERIEPLLVRLGLGARINQKVDRLSMGERQRVLVAQALALDPRLVLADEPTGSLDTVRSREVLRLLREVSRERGSAVLLATHDPQAVTFADRALALRDGRLHEYDPEALFADAQPSEVAS